MYELSVGLGDELVEIALQFRFGNHAAVNLRQPARAVHQQGHGDARNPIRNGGPAAGKYDGETDFVFGQTLALASAHVKVLRGACLVVSEKRGRQVFCRLAGESVERFWLALRALGEELLPEAQVVLRQFQSDRDTLVQLSPEELAAKLKSGRITLLDLRPPEEFAAAHLPGARNLPFAQIDAGEVAALNLPPRGKVYAYCRGPYCVMAREGTRKLRQLGVPVRRLPFSVPEWRAYVGVVAN